MRATPLEHKITEIVAPVAQDLGLAVVCVKIAGEGNAQNVQVMAEDPKTRRLGVDDCAKLSKAISVVMDVEDPIKGAYLLEVSSPGIDRPLTRLEDFQTYEGFEVKLETMMPTESGQKRFRGHLKGLNEEMIILDTDQGEFQIDFGSLAKAKLVLTDELIKATARS